MSHSEKTTGIMRQPVRGEALAGIVRMLAEIAVDDYLSSVNERQDEPTTRKNDHARRTVRPL